MSSSTPREEKGKEPQSIPIRPKAAGGFESFRRLDKGIKVYPFEVKKLNEDNTINWFGIMEEELLAQNAWEAIVYGQEVGAETVLQEREASTNLYMYDLKASLIICKGLSDKVATDVWCH